MTPLELSVSDAPNYGITYDRNWQHKLRLIILLAGTAKGVSITVPLTSCLTGLD
jgi:hypothetical protein